MAKKKISQKRKKSAAEDGWLKVNPDRPFPPPPNKNKSKTKMKKSKSAPGPTAFDLSRVAWPTERGIIKRFKDWFISLFCNYRG